MGGRLVEASQRASGGRRRALVEFAAACDVGRRVLSSRSSPHGPAAPRLPLSLAVEAIPYRRLVRYSARPSPFECFTQGWSDGRLCSGGFLLLRAPRSPSPSSPSTSRPPSRSSCGRISQSPSFLKEQGKTALSESKIVIVFAKAGEERATCVRSRGRVRERTRAWRALL
jgi:hypothetical protein